MRSLGSCVLESVGAFWPEKGKDDRPKSITFDRMVRLR